MRMAHTGAPQTGAPRERQHWWLCSASSPRHRQGRSALWCRNRPHPSRHRPAVANNDHIEVRGLPATVRRQLLGALTANLGTCWTTILFSVLAAGLRLSLDPLSISYVL